MVKRLFVLSLLVTLGGCFAAPSYYAPSIAVPAAFPAAAAGHSETVMRAEKVARDTLPAPMRSVTFTDDAPRSVLRELGDSTLTALMLEARRSSNDVRAAAARLSAARASRRLVSLDLLPTVTAVGSTTRQQQSVAVIPGLTQQLPQQQYWDVGFDASLELDIFGRVARNVRAQQAFVASAEYGLDDVQLSVMAEVARSYFDLGGAQQQLAVSLRNAENQRRIVKLTEQRLAAGRGTAFDTERAKAALYLTLAATPAFEAQIAVHRQRIADLLGRTPDALPPALLGSRPLPHLPDTLYTGSPDQLIRRRPDVQAAERQLAAESMLVGAARAEYLPRLTLGARAGYVATSFDSLSRAGTSRLLAGPMVTFPLFDLARVSQRVEVAHARMAQAQAEHNATVTRALNEGEAALVAYDRAHARLAILADAQASSARAADLAQQRFEAGLTDLLQVLDAQRTLLEAENQLVMGRTAAATALVTVYKAVGGTLNYRQATGGGGGGGGS